MRMSFEKGVGIFSLVRISNILVLVFAQLLTSIFIFSLNPFKETVSDYKLWLIIFSTAFGVSGGYIINSFFDQKKDIINRPYKTLLEINIKNKTKFRIYFLLSFFSLITSIFVSFNAFIFFSFYIIIMYLYSHLFKKYLWFGSMLSTLLTIFPFFAITLYYKNFNYEILTHALYLYFLICVRELVKDLFNLKGDILNNYKTFPSVFGENNTKLFITFLVLLLYITVIILDSLFILNLMRYYFYMVLFVITIFLFYLWKKSNKTKYGLMLQTIRVVIFLGVICLPLLTVVL